MERLTVGRRSRNSESWRCIIMSFIEWSRILIVYDGVSVLPPLSDCAISFYQTLRRWICCSIWSIWCWVCVRFLHFIRCWLPWCLWEICWTESAAKWKSIFVEMDQFVISGTNSRYTSWRRSPVPRREIVLFSGWWSLRMWLKSTLSSSEALNVPISSLWHPNWFVIGIEIENEDAVHWVAAIADHASYPIHIDRTPRWPGGCVWTSLVQHLHRFFAFPFFHFVDVVLRGQTLSTKMFDIETRSVGYSQILFRWISQYSDRFRVLQNPCVSALGRTWAGCTETAEHKFKLFGDEEHKVPDLSDAREFGRDSMRWSGLLIGWRGRRQSVVLVVANTVAAVDIQWPSLSTR